MMQPINHMHESALVTGQHVKYKLNYKSGDISGVSLVNSNVFYNFYGFLKNKKGTKHLKNIPIGLS